MMGHGRRRRQVILLAAGALPPDEAAAAAAHARSCSRCAQALSAQQRVQALLAEEAGAGIPLPVTFEALESRVRARLREPEAPARRPFLAGPVLTPATAIAVVAALAGVLTRGHTPPPRPAPPVAAQATTGIAAAAAGPATEELLRRMERSLAREHAARYLAEAQDVLVTVATGPPPCPRARRTIEVRDEARRSRDLLARRALLVELAGDEVASAGPVLAEVEHLLREVAALPSCVRPAQLQALEREIERRRVLMKIDLMQRELLG